MRDSQRPILEVDLAREFALVAHGDVANLNVDAFFARLQTNSRLVEDFEVAGAENSRALVPRDHRLACVYMKQPSL